MDRYHRVPGGHTTRRLANRCQGVAIVARNAIIVGVLVLLAACGSNAATPATTTPSATAELPIVGLDVVKQFFPEISTQQSDGVNDTATGNPVLTRMVIYASADGQRRITVSLDRYANTGDAGSAYEESVDKSEAVAGFSPLPPPQLGEKAFAGIVTQGEESHVGIGVLSGQQIIGATAAGFNPSPDAVAKLIDIAREEVTAASG